MSAFLIAPGAKYPVSSFCFCSEASTTEARRVFLSFLESFLPAGDVREAFLLENTGKSFLPTESSPDDDEVELLC